MGLLGDLFAAPLKIVNAPLRALENLAAGGERVNEENRIFSKPLDALADEISKIDEDKK